MPCSYIGFIKYHNILYLQFIVMLLSTRAAGALVATVLTSTVVTASPAMPRSSGGLASCLPSDAQVVWRDGSATYALDAIGQAIFRTRTPAAIIFATSAADVSQSVKCANANGVVPVARSGGHSYEALSSLNDALVIDLSKMSQVTFQTGSDGSQQAVAPAGIRLGNLYTALYNKNPSFSFPAGVCPSVRLTVFISAQSWHYLTLACSLQVGLGGHVAAGGYGSLGRNHGLAADSVLSATVVLADGSITTASPTQNSDLFSAIRGGGGGSYGIVVDMTLAVATVPYHYVAALNYYPKDTAAVVKKWTTWLLNTLPKTNNPVPGSTTGATFDGRDVNMQLNLFQGSLQLRVHYSPSTQRSANELLQILTHSGMADTDSGFHWEWANNGADKPKQVTTMVAHAFAANPTNEATDDTSARAVVTVPQEHLDASWKDRSRLKSDYVSSAQVGPNLFTALAKAVTDSQKMSAWSMIQLEPYGGVIATGPSSPNAFPHRDVLFVVQYGLYFDKTNAKDPKIPAGIAWLGRTEAALKSVTTQAKYQGYVDLDVSTPGSSYYGSNLPALVAVKNRYDPNNRFWSDLVQPTSKNTIWFGNSFAH
ncbi:hypothetical protein HKX48_006966 [Thoreauomyces humboldtii]|nr:hypothetical protein HKX48_006966 [Thoreauomyces humboldtii]